MTANDGRKTAESVCTAVYIFDIFPRMRNDRYTM